MTRKRVTRILTAPDDLTIRNQVAAIKRQYPDVLLFFRLGDFYEAFDDDAVTAGAILGLAPSTRSDGTQSLGLPFFSAEERINALIVAGHKVALCEQIAKPEATK